MCKFQFWGFEWDYNEPAIIDLFRAEVVGDEIWWRQSLEMLPIYYSTLIPGFLSCQIFASLSS